MNKSLRIVSLKLVIHQVAGPSKSQNKRYQEIGLSHKIYKEKFGKI